MPRKILVTGGVDGPIHLVEHPADSEHELQTVLLANPHLMPAEDLGIDDELLVVGRETTLASGSVDLLCLSKAGEVVIIEFKTGPKNPDFRHALAQVIDYGSDLWKLNGWNEFDEGVVHRHLASRYVDAKFAQAATLREAAVLAWDLSEEEWEALVSRLGRVLSTGDFVFVVSAQRFTDSMHDSVRYLNETTRYGKYFLVELIRLDGANRTGYAAQVVEKPSTRSGAAEAAGKANENDFLAAIADVRYREAMSELFSTVSALGLVVAWYSKGASIRLKSPDRAAPISIGWVFLEGGQWYTAKHVTFGVDPSTLKNHPTVAPAITAFCERLKEVPGGKPATGTLNAVIFEPDVFPSVKAQTFELLAGLKSSAESAETVTQ
ncbi:endonuclease NucS [Nocardioides sp. cx-169]|uniref:endonuclease NucS domain-containing protein n=1 Tax=Nocardioides sp. cx-169 TaxID=2899080 RepID=UPI001E49BEF8|nr:endonuclease NucS domain-containing protein [Nocardioides sp. cx-169]MCD4534260.1 endonuclease NucS [Nocardioides sp. cx-169]